MNRSLCHAASAFLKDEAGSLSLLTLGILPAMIVAGGMAVDYMHLEASRVRLQATLDRAVVAAASLTQTQDAEDVVRSYFEKAGLGDRVSTIDVQEALNFKQVSATASLDVDTFFLRLFGVDQLPAAAAGSAIESHSSVEISLVLDVSGSMNDNQRLPRLKSAASNFIDSVLRANQEVAEVSISVVPFSTQVSAGPDILAQFVREDSHDYSHCIDFAMTDFRTVEINLAHTYQQTGHFDPFTTSARPLDLPVCPPVHETNRRVMFHSSDGDALKARINSFAAAGNTSIDLGVKWGSWLLDPSSRPVVTAGVDAGSVDPDFAGRPLGHDEDNVMKVLIVMSDGANTTQYRLHPDHSDGESRVWRDPETGRTSMRHWRYGGHQYYSPHDGKWRWQPYDDDGNALNGNGDPVQLHELELWRDYSVRWNAYYHVYQAIGGSSNYYSWIDAPLIEVGPGEKDSRTHDVCQAARDAGIVVFTIGFEAGWHGDDTLRDCASSPAHFFDVEGLEIEEAFRAISSTINRLRLSS